VARRSEPAARKWRPRLLRLPESPRARRRLYRRSALGAAVLVGLLLVLFFRNTGSSLKAPVENKAPVVLKTPKTVPASAADKAAAERTLDTFFRTVVVRRDELRAWNLVTTRFREGTTRTDWKNGLLPVVPYPAAEFKSAGATLDHSYKGVLGYDVLVVPKTLKGKQQVYGCELDKVGGRWLVDWCMPKKTL
jgi:hypothetical protein